MKNGMKNLWNHFKDSICFHDFKCFYDRLKIDGIAVSPSKLNVHLFILLFRLNILKANTLAIAFLKCKYCLCPCFKCRPVCYFCTLPWNSHSNLLKAAGLNTGLYKEMKLFHQTPLPPSFPKALCCESSVRKRLHENIVFESLVKMQHCVEVWILSKNHETSLTPY